MKEYPIRFTDEMVRAILDGSKTQHRLPMKPQPVDDVSECEFYHPTRVSRSGEEYPGKLVYGCYDNDNGWVSPFGGPDGILWVRECWANYADAVDPEGKLLLYRADLSAWWDMGPYGKMLAEYNPLDEQPSYKPTWRQSNHMPREASRITLDVKLVWRERLHDTKPEDWLAELGTKHSDYDQANIHQYWREDCWAAFCERWDSIYAATGYGWNENPWVWVFEYERLSR